MTVTEPEPLGRGRSREIGPWGRLVGRLCSDNMCALQTAHS